MKVLLLNGSTRKNGYNFLALTEIARTLKDVGIGAEIIQMGGGPVRDCLACSGGAAFAHKPGAVVMAARRAGTTASLDVLNKYLLNAQMPVVSSTHWKMVFGPAPGLVERDTCGTWGVIWCASGPERKKEFVLPLPRRTGGRILIAEF